MKSEIWIAEFRGLFWGEGCADIQRYTRKRHKNYIYRPRLRMQLRADDGEMLFDIQKKYGGTVNKIDNSHRNNHDAYQWTLANKQSIVECCNDLLEGQLPAKKKHQIKLVREAAEMRAGRTNKVSDAERVRLEELYGMLRQMKKFGNK